MDSNLLVSAHTHTTDACCPRCQQPARRIHSRYVRTPRDLPVSESPVQLHLLVRRFFCDQPACPQRTFAERVPDIVPVHGQRTARLTRSLQWLGFALGGEAGARLGTKLRMPVSPATVLRIIRATPTPSCPTPRVLGVDDFALRKGQIYGTLLVDLEARMPVDLLPDRTAGTLATWLKAHPDVEIITRDRSPEYARGARDGAPAALQVVDRWHLLQNLRETLERILNRLHTDLRQLPTPAPVSGAAPTTNVTRAHRPLRLPSPPEQAGRDARRARRYARYEAVRTLSAQHVPMLQIAKQLGMSRMTVRTFATSASFPERAHVARPSQLDPYVAYLTIRVNEGCTNSSELWRDLHARGYGGTRKQVARWVQHQRPAPAATTPKKYVPAAPIPNVDQAATTSSPPLVAPRHLVWLLLRERTALDAAEEGTLSWITQHPQVARAYELAKQFQTMVRTRTAAALDPWLAACLASGIPDLESFAVGLARDAGALRAALTEVWSNGQTEGQVTRLKLLKRQMYGRANFDLLRRRVLAA